MKHNQSNITLSRSDINHVSQSIAKYTSKLISDADLEKQKDLIKATYHATKKKLNNQNKYTRKLLVNSLIDLFDQTILNHELKINIENMKNLNNHLINENLKLKNQLKAHSIEKVNTLSSPKNLSATKTTCNCL